MNMNMKKKMKAFFTMKRHANEGFTLVELIVVIAILAILAGVAVPAYSGYIEKAERAADDQLLGTLNTAFAAACAFNGESNYGRSDNPSITINAGAVASNALNTANDMIDASFEEFFEGGTFKVATELFYKQSIGGFAFSSGVYANLTFDEALIALVKGSEFYLADGLGVDNLMDKVDFITNLAASLADQTANNGDGNGAWQMLTRYNQALLDDLGIVFPENYDELSEPEQLAVMAPLKSLVDEKIAVLNTQNIAGWDKMSPEEKSQYAQNQILANYAVLDAAKQMKGQNADTVLASIKNTSNFTQLIKDNENGVSQAAAAYGLYTAYAYSISDPTEREKAIAKANDPVALLSAMNDDGFKTYLDKPEAKTNLQGYMAAMEMVDSSAQDKDAVHSLMVNGFTDPELLAVIQQAMK